MCEFKLPQNYRLEYSADQISAAVAKLGAEITPWAAQVAKETGQDLLAIPVLRGGVFFFADLVRQIKHSVKIAPARAWAYEPNENIPKKREIGLNLQNVEAAGRSVLIVDDMCDSGRTLKALKEAFVASGAREVKAAVLIRRILPGQEGIPDWAGFEYNGAEWFVGYGMDDKEKLRNLPSVYTLRG